MMLSFVAVTLTLSSTPALSSTYTVQSGDSLYKIGQKFGITANEIKAVNRLNINNIIAGQKLCIPKRYVYTVKKNDTLFKIAKAYGITYNDLKKINNLKYTTIYPGQKLYVPGASSGTTRGNIRENTRENTNTLSRKGSRVSREEYNLMARAVYGESRGEPFEGQVAVAAVILNRIKSASFPNTIKGVIYQPGAFTALNDGQLWLNPNSTSYKAVDAALSGWDPTYGSLYYWNPSTATSKWIWSRKIISRIGKHVFGI